MNKGITVQELSVACNKLMQQGYGDKHIQISQDDEGNGFHSLFYLFVTDQSDLDMYIDAGLMPCGIDSSEDIVILG